MYSLTFCVRVMLPERHQWTSAVQAAAVTGQQRAQTSPRVRTMSSYREMDASFSLGFALCCHSNAARAPIANPLNSAQLGGSLYHAPKLYPGPCSSVGVRPQTDIQTHRRA